MTASLALDLSRGRGDDRDLGRRHRAGDERARAMLIERHLPLARRLAYRYRRGSEPAEDLVQVACLGLVKAADRWDPDRGFAFSTLAVPTILGELRRHFRDATWTVRPPRGLQETCLRVERARSELAAASGREASALDVADRLGLSRGEVEEALQATRGRRADSLDVPPADDESRVQTAGDAFGHEDSGYALAEARLTIERLSSRLDPRAREVLRLRFEEDLTQPEIGERVGCSQMQVSRIIRTSLETLRRRDAHA
ncbi:MAG: polymerase sigma-B factor [Solirubrobacteraceae bacterium]|jgi:RNA polymerase sigma-B factor|nr:polymerase sigma-B factor [Solirubrobacteraceae bacterium]